MDCADPFDQKVFIENKGQFDKNDLRFIGKILFSARSGGVNLFFSSRGLIYQYDSVINTAKEAINNQEPGLKNNAGKEPEGKKKKAIKPLFL